VASALARAEWAQAGDLLLLSSQSDRTSLLKLMETVVVSGWKPGDELPSL